MFRSGLRPIEITLTALVVGTVAVSCGGHRPASVASAPASSGPRRIVDPYTPFVDPAAFSTTIDNPYLPLTPGTRIIYQADTEAGRQQTTTEVTRETRTVMGVSTVVVHDTVTVGGKTTEDTFDWFAQDREGNVWYFGEATTKFDDGAVSMAGSFEAGVNGALPGIVMLGAPHPGDQYRQEYAKGVAEDIGEVLSLSGAETTPLTGPTQNLLVIKDLDRLDMSTVENKYYAHGIGLVLTVTTAGAAEREEATAVERF